jgi:hypothetical protein
MPEFVDETAKSWLRKVVYRVCGSYKERRKVKNGYARRRTIKTGR